MKTFDLARHLSSFAGQPIQTTATPWPITIVAFFLATCPGGTAGSPRRSMMGFALPQSPRGSKSEGFFAGAPNSSARESWSCATVASTRPNQLDAERSLQPCGKRAVTPQIVSSRAAVATSPSASGPADHCAKGGAPARGHSAKSVTDRDPTSSPVRPPPTAALSYAGSPDRDNPLPPSRFQFFDPSGRAGGLIASSGR